MLSKIRSKIPKIPNAPESFTSTHYFMFSVSFAYTLLLFIISRMFLNIVTDNSVDNENDKKLGMVISYTTMAIFWGYIILIILIFKKSNKEKNTIYLRIALALFIIQIFCGLIICFRIIHSLKNPKYSNIYNLASGTLIYLAIICFIIIPGGYSKLANDKKNKITDDSKQTGKIDKTDTPEVSTKEKEKEIED